MRNKEMIEKINNLEREIACLNDKQDWTINNFKKPLESKIDEHSKRISELELGITRLKNPPKFAVGDSVCVPMDSFSANDTFTVIGHYYRDNNIVPTYRLLTKAGVYEELSESSLVAVIKQKGK